MALKIRQWHLLKGFREGDPKACVTIVRTVYRFLLHLTGDAGAAEDLSQETLLAALKKLDDFRGGAFFMTWLHKIAYNKFIDSQRRGHRERISRDALTNRSGDCAGTPGGPVASAVSGERCRLLYEALDELERPDRTAVILHYFQKLSYSQMSSVLGEPVGTVKWRTSEALRKLKSSLDGRI